MISILLTVIIPCTGHQLVIRRFQNTCRGRLTAGRRQLSTRHEWSPWPGPGRVMAPPWRLPQEDVRPCRMRHSTVRWPLIHSFPTCFSLHLTRRKSISLYLSLELFHVSLVQTEQTPGLDPWAGPGENLMMPVCFSRLFSRSSSIKGCKFSFSNEFI